MNKSRVARMAMVVLAGGVLLQAGGCTTVFAPVLLSFFESFVLSGLTGGVSL